VQDHKQSRIAKESGMRVPTILSALLCSLLSVVVLRKWSQPRRVLEVGCARKLELSASCIYRSPAVGKASGTLAFLAGPTTANEVQAAHAFLEDHVWQRRSRKTLKCRQPWLDIVTHTLTGINRPLLQLLPRVVESSPSTSNTYHHDRHPHVLQALVPRGCPSTTRPMDIECGGVEPSV
jgi:hypothetical protein